MYARILVAVDGSEPAERVVPYAEALARTLGAAITLLRATPLPGQVIAEAGPVLDPTPVVEAEHEQAADYLQMLAGRLRRTTPGLAIDCEEVEGPAAEVVLARAEALGADLIAMTSKGSGRLEGLLFGSVAGAVLKGARCPVLLVPADVEH